MTKSRNGFARIEEENHHLEHPPKKGFVHIGGQRHAFPKEACYLAILEKAKKWNLFPDKKSASAWLAMMHVPEKKIKKCTKYFIKPADAIQYANKVCQ